MSKRRKMSDVLEWLREADSLGGYQPGPETIEVFDGEPDPPCPGDGRNGVSLIVVRHVGTTREQYESGSFLVGNNGTNGD